MKLNKHGISIYGNYYLTLGLICVVNNDPVVKTLDWPAL